MQKIAWQWITGLEVLARATNQTLQKVIGLASLGLGQVFFATVVYSAVQTVASFFIVKGRKTPLVAPRKLLVGALVFGCFAFISTAAGFNVFRLGGDMGINAFIIALSIVPSAVIDRIQFREPLTLRLWFGIALAIVGGYVMLGFPAISKLASLPVWLWFSLMAMFFVAFNQGITRYLKDIDPFVKNVWGGLAFFICSLAALAFEGGIPLAFNIASPVTAKIYVVGAAMGLVAIVLWSANLLPYKAGAAIVPKKLIADAGFLTLAMLSGIIFFGEPAVIEKFAALPIFIAAYLLIEQPRARDS